MMDAGDASAGATPIPEDKARYEAVRRELVQALQKKRMIDRQLAQLEVQIYNFEGSYLSETAQHSGGNIIQGFDGYLKTQSVGRRRHEPTDADRVFSNSSLTYQKSLELLGEADSEDTLPLGPSSLANTSTTNNSSRGPTPGLTTVVLPPPTQRTIQETQQLSAAAQKKARDKEYQRRKRATAAREKSQALAAQAQAAAVAAAVSGGLASEDSGEGAGGEGTTARGRMSKKPRQADDD